MDGGLSSKAIRRHACVTHGVSLITAALLCALFPHEIDLLFFKITLNLLSNQLERIMEWLVCSEAKIKAFQNGSKTIICLNLSKGNMMIGLFYSCTTQIQVRQQCLNGRGTCSWPENPKTTIKPKLHWFFTKKHGVQGDVFFLTFFPTFMSSFCMNAVQMCLPSGELSC